MSLVVKHKAAVGATRISELVVAGRETHEAAVGGTHELVIAGGETHEAGVGE